MNIILTAHETGTLNIFFSAFQSVTEKQKLYRCINHLLMSDIMVYIGRIRIKNKKSTSTNLSLLKVDPKVPYI